MAQNTEELKAKVSIDVSEASKNIAELTKKQKELNSQIKLADTNIKNHGTNVDNLSAKQSALKTQVETTKKQIEEYRKKLAAVVATEGANSASAVQLRTKINQLTGTLDTQETQLKDVTEELEKTKDGYDDAGDASKDAAEQIEKDSVSISDALKKIKDSTAFKIIEATFTALGNTYAWMKETATEAASNWDDIATAAVRAQEETTKYQAMMYASDFLDFDISAYYRGRNKVQKATQEEIETAFSDAGLTFDWSNVDFGDADSVYTAILAQLGGADDAQQALIEEALFGERLGTNLRTVYGEDAVAQLKELQAEAERLGMITTETQAQSLQYLNDAHDKWNNVKDGLYMNLGAVFADNLTGMYDGLSEYVGTFSKALQIYKDAGGGEAGKTAMQEFLDGALTEVDENGETIGDKLFSGLAGTIENFGVLADLASVFVDSLATELSTNEALQTALSSLGESLSALWLGEDGASGLYGSIIKPYVLDPVGKWLEAEATYIASLIGNGIVDAIPGLRVALEAVDAVTDPSNYTPEALADNPMTAYYPIWDNTADYAPDSPAGGGGVTNGNGGGRIVTETYTETDNSQYEQNVTIYITGAQSPEMTGEAVADALADYEAQLKRANTGGGTGVSRAGIVYD